MEDVAVGELGHRVGQVADIEGAGIHLAVIRLHTPYVLVEVAARIAFRGKTGPHGLTVDGADRIAEVLIVIFACHEFEVLVRIHTPQVDRVGHVVVQVFELALERIRQSHHRIVITSDIQMVLIHHQIGRTGTGGTKTIVVAGAVLRAAYQRRVLPAAVVGLLAAEQRERLLGARAAGDNGDVQFSIEYDHVPDRTAEDVIGVAACRIVEQILLRGDHLERILALGRIRGGYDVSPVITDHAGDKLVAQHRKTANAD